MGHYKSQIVFGCSSSTRLTEKICKKLGVKPGLATLGRFKDGEIRVKIGENVRDADVFVVCSTKPPADNFFELILMSSALRGSSAGRITLVIPYLGYNRQERKDQSRVPISAKVVIDMLQIARADRVLLLDLHAEATASHFDPMGIDQLYAGYTVVPYLEKIFNGDDFVIASPDAGGVTRARQYGRMLKNQSLVIFSKERPDAGEVNEEAIRIIGDVAKKKILIIDDMIDSGGTVVAAARKAREEGAKSIVFFATHGLFSDNAVKRLDSSGVIDEVIVTDSIEHPGNAFDKSKNTKFTVLSIDTLFAEAIRRLHNSEPLSSLILR